MQHEWMEGRQRTTCYAIAWDMTWYTLNNVGPLCWMLEFEQNAVGLALRAPSNDSVRSEHSTFPRHTAMIYGQLSKVNKIV